MNIHWNNSYSNSLLSSFKEKISSFLADNQRQRIGVIALVALSCFAIGYVLYLRYSIKVSKIEKNQPQETDLGQKGKLAKEEFKFPNPFNENSNKIHHKENGQEINAKLDLKQFDPINDALEKPQSEPKKQVEKKPQNGVPLPVQKRQNKVDLPEGKDAISERLSFIGTKNGCLPRTERGKRKKRISTI